MVPVSKESVREAAAECGIDIVGFAPASPLDRQTRDLAAFCDPASVLASAASVVCAAQCYLKDEPDDLSRPGEPHGLIAPYTRRNHYKDLRERLKKLAVLLADKAEAKPKSKCSSCGPLAEKPLARGSGVGWYGKHGIIITEGFGSWVVLGEMVTELEFEPDPEIPGGCGDCDACVRACPTGAITSPGCLDRSKCFQHLTNSASPMPRDWRKLWGRRLYGCATCQEVCPKNAGVKPSGRTVETGVVGPSIPLLPLLTMTEAEYRTRYSGNQIAARWVRFDAIRRNACLSLGNSQDPAAIPALTDALRCDPSALIRGHAAWALGKIGGARSKSALEKQRPAEIDAQAAGEISSALEAPDGTSSSEPALKAQEPSVHREVKEGSQADGHDHDCQGVR
ncbi:MAG: tRNA epoxyqueuosine(34) reductase QueG [Elusimicrobia bacterium]|nr:tRNA epoxyqueuosine(34) reductase QueG [Elusimicrobiota bacterium]